MKVLLSVFAWESENQTYPSISSAAIIESLGETVFNMVFPFPLFSPHVFRVKFVSFNQVSSILITLFPRESWSIMTRAYCYRRIWFIGELADGLSFFALIKLSFISFFITERTSWLLTCKPVESPTRTNTICEFVIGVQLCFNLLISSIMANLFWDALRSRFFSFFILSGLFLKSRTRSFTSCTLRQAAARHSPCPRLCVWSSPTRRA